MNNLEGFMKDSASYAGLFTFPVCSELEGNYTRIFTESSRKPVDVYITNDNETVAEFTKTEVTGLGSWVRGGPDTIQGSVLIKNPQRIPENISRFGAMNAVLFDMDSGIVFAGKFSADRVTVLRPVIPTYQDIFREEFQKNRDEYPAIAS